MEQEYKEGARCKFFGAYAKIYTLSDNKGNVFYVGCTTQLETRINCHLIEARNDSRLSNKKKNEIIRSLDYQIVVKIVDMIWVTSGTKISWALKKARPLEKEWIERFTQLGYDLCNRVVQKAKLKSEPKPEFIGQTFYTKTIVDAEKYSKKTRGKENKHYSIIQMKNYDIVKNPH